MVLQGILLLLVLFIALFGIAIFVPTLIEILINVPILYVIVVRSHIEISQERRYTEYTLGLLTGLFFYLANQNLFLGLTTHYILWSPTIFLMVCFITTQIIIMVKTLIERHNRNKAHS